MGIIPPAYNSAPVVQLLPFNYASNGLGSAWTVIFDEEFSNPLNPSVWSPFWFSNLTPLPGTGTGGNPAVPGAQANVNVTGGQALLTYDGTNGAIISTNPSDGVVGHTGFQFIYGYVEASFTVPDSGTGTLAHWPAIWFTGQNWPVTGEVDSFEGLGGTNYFGYHYGTTGSPQTEQHANPVAPGAHIVGVNWEPGRLDLYIDGSLVDSITDANLTGGFTITSSPLFLVADYSASPTDGGGPVPQSLNLDYYRVWQTTGTSPPVNNSVPRINNTSPTQGVAIATDNGSWSGTPTPTFTYNWQNNPGGVWTNTVPAITSASYTPVAADIGLQLRSQVIAFNGVGGSVTANSAATSTVTAAATPPVNTGLPTTSPPSPAPTDGDVLTASPGTWTGSPSPTFTYQWQVTSGVSWNPATGAGATTTSYTVALADISHQLRVEVTGHNSAGNVPADSSATLTVVGSPPGPLGPPIIS